MLDLASQLLEQVLVNEIPGLAPDRIRFHLPDDNWRTKVSRLNGDVFNIYQVDMPTGRGGRQCQTD